MFKLRNYTSSKKCKKLKSKNQNLENYKANLYLKSKQLIKEFFKCIVLILDLCCVTLCGTATSTKRLLRHLSVFIFLGFWSRPVSPVATSSMSNLLWYTQFWNTVVSPGQAAYLSILATRSSESRKGYWVSYSPIPAIMTLSHYANHPAWCSSLWPLLWGVA